MKRIGVLVALALLGFGCGSHPLEVMPSSTVRGSIESASRRATAADRLVGMSFPTAGFGLVVTGDGRLLQTADAGRSWRLVGKLAPGILDFPTAHTGFALTNQGRLLETDGGERWRSFRFLQRFHLGEGGPFSGAVDFVDPEHGWVATPGGRIYRTSDGGSSWKRLSFHRCYAFGGLSFLDLRTGFVACTGQPATIDSPKDLYATRNGGATWRLIGRTHLMGRGRSVPDIPIEGFAHALRFRTPAEGFLSAERVGIYVTRNGGRSWQTALDTDDAYQVIDTAWPTAQVAYALIGWGMSALLRSSDGARHWRLVFPTDPGPPANVLSFASLRVGIGAGTTGYGGTPGTIVRTTDGGRTWTLRSNLPGPVSQLVRVAPHSVWAFVNARRRDDLYRSGDEGHTWERLATPAGTGFAALDVAPDGTVFLGSEKGALYRSEDRGTSWQAIRRRGGELRGIHFVSANEGLLVRDPKLLQTRDGGRTWRTVPTYGLEVRDALVLDGKHWWLLAISRSHAQLLRTVDGGRHWEAIRLPHLLSSLQFVTPLFGYAPDYDGILRTTDGGRTWRWIHSPRLFVR